MSQKKVGVCMFVGCKPHCGVLEIVAQYTPVVFIRLISHLIRATTLYRLCICARCPHTKVIVFYYEPYRIELVECCCLLKHRRPPHVSLSCLVSVCMSARPVGLLLVCMQRIVLSSLSTASEDYASLKFLQGFCSWRDSFRCSV